MMRTLTAALGLLALAASPALAQTAAPAAPTRPMPPAMSTNAPAKPAEAAKPAPLLDINTASEKELRELPGIGEARAAAIVKGRPYRGKDDIVSKAGVPQATYDKIRDRIVARQKP